MCLVGVDLPPITDYNTKDNRTAPNAYLHHPRRRSLRPDPQGTDDLLRSGALPGYGPPPPQRHHPRRDGGHGERRHHRCHPPQQRQAGSMVHLPRSNPQA